ncbi:MAG TPA: MFS transporter [Pseudolabrys sp.]|nr:MFS transporter [Pseudolabrys sp.]
MSQATGVLGSARAPYLRVVGAVSAAHFVSHYYQLILAPLLPFVRDEYHVTYTQIGLVLATFNVVTAALQTPAGFLVDKLGARALLVAGLAIGASAFVVAGLVHSFLVMVLMFAIAGIGNTVYHPADYAMLSQHVSSKQIGQAFSVHTFAGMMGSAVAPASLLVMESVWGWRGAFIGAGILGFVVAAVLLSIRAHPGATPSVTTAQARAPESPAGWRLLFSGPILLNLLFFVLLALISGGLYNYSVAALVALYGTPLTIANAALSANLLLSAIGVLFGGFLVGRTIRHGAIATIGLTVMAIAIALVAWIDLASFALIATMAIGGFFSGIIMPSRDMIVRQITPPGSFGKVFGFVTTGFNIGGIASALIFGAIMDHGSPRLVFLAIAAFSLISIATVVTRPARRP